LREESGAIYVIAGGAKFHVPDLPTLNRIFDPTKVRQLWDGAPNDIPTIPHDGTLLREESGAVYVIAGGVKFHVPDPATLNRLFNPNTIRQLWIGALDGIPAIPRDGTLLRDTAGAIYVIEGGAKFHVPDPATLHRLFGSAGIHQLWDGALDAIPSIPGDRTLLREESGAIYVVAGGAKFHVPDPATLNRLFDPNAIRQLWDGALNDIPTIPRDGTLLREESGAIYVIAGAAKFHVPDPATLNRLFDTSTIRQLWDGALNDIPTIPRDGTLLREESGTIHVIAGGAKFRVRRGFVTGFEQLWNGAVDLLPTIPHDGTLLREESGPIHFIINGKRFHVRTPADLAALRHHNELVDVPDGAPSGIPYGGETPP
jgi:hypothetical protein